MKIAQVAPLYESVPPQYYGGTERVVSYLTEALVQQGHEVTLFASGDSVTQARLVAACARSLRLDDQCIDQLAHHIVLLEQVFQQAHAFDILHFHIDYLHFPLSSAAGHAPRDHAAWAVGPARLSPGVPDVSQRASGVDFQLPALNRSPGCSGRGRCIMVCQQICTPFKRRRARIWPFWGALPRKKASIRPLPLPEQVGMPLKIAAKVDRVDRGILSDGDTATAG